MDCFKLVTPSAYDLILKADEHVVLKCNVN